MINKLPGEGTLILNYREWQTAVMDGFKAQHNEQNCPDCNGTGETICYHCNQDMECEECDGKGAAWFNDDGDLVALPSTGLLTYKKYVIRTFLKLSKFTGRSYWKSCKAFLSRVEKGAL